jgi:multidrug efflux pump subunit AcrA (membrane-fusion protein)
MAQALLEAQAALAQAQAQAALAQAALAQAVLEQAPQDVQALAQDALTQALDALAQAQAQAVQAAQDVDDAAHAMVANVHGVVDAFPQQPAQPGVVHCGICELAHVRGALVNTTDIQAWCFACKLYSDYLDTNPTNLRQQGDNGFHACAGRAGGCRMVSCYF